MYSPKKVRFLLTALAGVHSNAFLCLGVTVLRERSSAEAGARKKLWTRVLREQNGNARGA